MMVPRDYWYWHQLTVNIIHVPMCLSWKTLQCVIIRSHIALCDLITQQLLDYCWIIQYLATHCCSARLPVLTEWGIIERCYAHLCTNRPKYPVFSEVPIVCTPLIPCHTLCMKGENNIICISFVFNAICLALIHATIWHLYKWGSFHAISNFLVAWILIRW